MFSALIRDIDYDFVVFNGDNIDDPRDDVSLTRKGEEILTLTM